MLGIHCSLGLIFVMQRAYGEVWEQGRSDKILPERPKLEPFKSR